MLTSDDRARLTHILDAIDKIEKALTGYSLTRFRDDWEKRLVIERLLEIIGEAANHISPELQESHPNVPWSQMIGMRNVVSHQYFRINAETIWKTAAEAVPPLRRAVEQILAEDSAS
ncbi:MAG: DUF86 domain-containing protein [Caldilineaceae bacterium]|nr:DUF86 domain-containing protein [Caldilineaceae bacterium]